MERIDTPEKVKEYLNQESIEYQEDDPEKWLLTLATRRAACLKQGMTASNAPAM